MIPFFSISGTAALVILAMIVALFAAEKCLWSCHVGKNLKRNQTWIQGIR